MERSEIKRKVTAVVVDKLAVAENEVKPEAEIVKDLGADSLDAVELMMAIEQEFNYEFTIPDDEAEKLSTIEALITYVEGKVNK